MPSMGVMQLVGKYGGTVGILALLYSAVLLAMLRIKMPRDKHLAQQRFVILAYSHLALGLGSLIVWGCVKIAPSQSENPQYQQQTQGDQSPIINDNHGVIQH